MAEARYYERMAQSLGDKERILPFLTKGTVLDVGAGGGDLAAVMATKGHDVVAVDNDPDAYRRLTTLPGVSPVLAHVDELSGIFPEQYFDNLVLCAVVHEIFSYDQPSPSFESLEITLRDLVSLVKPGGRIIIRDGIMPSNPAGLARIKAPIDVVQQYNAMTPFEYLRLRPHSEADWWWRSRHAVAEFAFTWTWGQENFHRETKERYQLFTTDGYQRFGPFKDYWLVHHSAVIQGGYYQRLAGTMQALEHNRWSDWFPATNALWVWEKSVA